MFSCFKPKQICIEAKEDGKDFIDLSLPTSLVLFLLHAPHAPYTPVALNWLYFPQRCLSLFRFYAFVQIILPLPEMSCPLPPLPNLNTLSISGLGLILSRKPFLREVSILCALGPHFSHCSGLCCNCLSIFMPPQLKMSNVRARTMYSLSWYCRHPINICSIDEF